MIMPEYITDSTKTWWDCTVDERLMSLPEGEMLVEVHYDSKSTFYQIQDWRFDEFKEWALVTWAAEIDDAHDIIIPDTAVDNLLDALEIVIEEVE